SLRARGKISLTLPRAHPHPAWTGNPPERLHAMRKQTSIAILCLLTVFGPSAACYTAEPAKAPPVDYSRDIKPLLAASCYACHGPDEGKRKGKLRLDLREEAIKKAIKAGDAAGSPLYQRLVTKEADEIMPPPSAKKDKLTPAQVELVRRWINEGAKFDVHWAY